jgi:hypothetical protein
MSAPFSLSMSRSRLTSYGCVLPLIRPDCDDLRYRCETNRADELLKSQARPTKIRGLLTAGATPAATLPDPVALITSANKRQNIPTTRPKKGSVPCLAKSCESVVPSHLLLCRMHYHECISGKQSQFPLRTGVAHYDASTNKIVYPLLGAPVQSKAKVSKAGTTPGPKSSVKAHAFASSAYDDSD